MPWMVAGTGIWSLTGDAGHVPFNVYLIVLRIIIKVLFKVC